MQCVCPLQGVIVTAYEIIALSFIFFVLASVCRLTADAMDKKYPLEELSAGGVRFVLFPCALIFFSGVFSVLFVIALISAISSALFS